MSTPKSPSISIITVVYNGAALLAPTIQSVQAQAAQEHIEYLLVDGASKDNSLDIIKSFAAQMPNIRWVSEPDKGLYDAMNKALRLAKGDFVWFMNCGDHIHGKNTVESLIQLITPEVGVLYGETLLVNDARVPVGNMSELSTRPLPQKLHVAQYLGGMRIVHQSFIARRSLCPAYLEDNLCADFDWCIRILKKSKKNVHTNMILSEYLMGGISKQHHKQSLKDRFNVMWTHFGLLRTVFAHIWIVIRAGLHKIKRIGKKSY